MHRKHKWPLVSFHWKDFIKKLSFARHKLDEIFDEHNSQKNQPKSHSNHKIPSLQVGKDITNSLVAFVSSYSSSHIDLASLAVEIRLPQADTLARDCRTLLSSAFSKRPVFNLDAIRLAKALHQLHC